MKNILILGLGEVGSSVAGLYTSLTTFKGIYSLYYLDTHLKDISKDISYIKPVKDLIPLKVCMLHVCIPFSKRYMQIVTDCIRLYKPDGVCIHSTVDIGVTREIFEQTGANIVHTPVMGLHPNLTESMQTFKKIIGPVNEKSEKVVVEHFNDLNVSCEVYKTPEDSEAAKLFSTSYYGHNIIFMQDVHNFCEENNLKFEDVYKKTNEIYNEGYEKMGLSHFKRPVLSYMGNGISGHCILPNWNILKDKFPLAKLGSEHCANS